VSGGRPKAPTALKLVKGTDRKGRSNGNEPEPMLLNDLKPPKHLAPRSAVVWTSLAPMLRRLQVLTEADVISLEMLCDAVADYRHAREQCGDDFVAISSKGSQMVSQWLVAKQMSSKRAESFMSRFGMDPVSRSKVMVEPQGDLFGAAASGTGRFFSPPAGAK
jgi:P27 family predicted phage terminase small subunit